MPMLKKRGRVVRGWVGIRVGPVPRALGERVGLGQRGALVNEVLPRGPADRAGLRRGDVIITFAGASVRGASKLPALAAHAVNRTVKVEVWRDGERHTFAVKIEAMPE